MRGWLALFLAASYEAVAVKETAMKCIICRGKLSKRERKIHARTASEIPFCVDCSIRSNRVAAKMKKVGAHA